MEETKNNVPHLYFGKQPVYIRYVAVDRESGEEKETHPTDIPYDKKVNLTDKFAKALGYQRV